MAGLTAITRTVPFCQPDSAPLFSVNAGVPIDEALELADALTAYIDAITAADALPKAAQARAVVQQLSEMTNALIKACRPAPSSAAA